MITLRMGSHDPHVIFLQRMLNNALVHDRSIAVLDEDGAFGRLTDAALRRFQSTYSGPAGRLVPDGVAGPLSWRALGLVTEIVQYFSDRIKLKPIEAEALLAGKPWLVVDEPSEGLDPDTERALCQRLAAWLDQTGTGLVLVSHRSGLHALARQVVRLLPVSGGRG